MAYLLKKGLKFKSHQLQAIIVKNILKIPNNFDHKDGRANVTNFHLLY
jgi:hypothetical protein